MKDCQVKSFMLKMPYNIKNAGFPTAFRALKKTIFLAKNPHSIAKTLLSGICQAEAVTGHPFDSLQIL